MFQSINNANLKDTDHGMKLGKCSDWSTYHGKGCEEGRRRSDKRIRCRSFSGENLIQVVL